MKAERKEGYKNGNDKNGNIYIVYSVMGMTF
jgi:hypothetical protein